MQTTVTLNNDIISIKVPIAIKRYRGQVWITLPERTTLPTAQPKPNDALVKALAAAYHWQQLLDGGQFDSLGALIKHKRLNSSYTSRLLRLNMLSPDIKQAILAGTQPPSLSQRHLLSPFPLLWEEQLTHFGFVK